ncbi:hypothetical protein, partial [Mesorhizobium sp. M2A.F.Ca.ET.067.02.1.1]|uniref:hypothetical protein n=1 Tax=Mesorhizobium sp. M2A.F.Ca.ET.067.02.1.1 TaxID=2496749 RepID=UPI001AED10FC
MRSATVSLSARRRFSGLHPVSRSISARRRLHDRRSVHHIAEGDGLGGRPSEIVNFRKARK